MRKAQIVAIVTFFYEEEYMNKGKNAGWINNVVPCIVVP